MGRSGVQVSILGFGCMRLPLLDRNANDAAVFDPNQPVDEVTTTAMIRHAIDNGINYFDTAYGYHGGKSEILLGNALKGYRERILLATKLPVWLVQTKEDFDRFLDEQLCKLNTSYLDFYLLHGLNRSTWPKAKALGVLGFLDQIRSDGRVKYAGFSFHDDVNLFKEIVDAYDWTMCMIQYNFFDEHYQAGRDGLRYATSKGLGVVAMEPLRGGRLTNRLPKEVQEIWNSAHMRRTPAEWAFRWVWNHPEVSIAISGMSEMEQLVENLRIVKNITTPYLAHDEQELFRRVTDCYAKMLKVGCTRCGYCLPCPAGIDIPMNFSLYNDTFLYKDAGIPFMIYNHMLASERRASNCSACGQCEPRCPQEIPIINELKNVHNHLSR